MLIASVSRLFHHFLITTFIYLYKVVSLMIYDLERSGSIFVSILDKYAFFKSRSFSNNINKTKVKDKNIVNLSDLRIKPISFGC